MLGGARYTPDNFNRRAAQLSAGPLGGAGFDFGPKQPRNAQRDLEGEHPMDIVSLAAWGEFLGGIAVVVSLIYLAGQVRQNSRLLRNSTTATMGAADLALGSLLAADPKLSAIVNGGLEDPASLSADDRHRFNVVMDMMMRAFLRSQVFAQGGGMEASIWQTEVRSYGGMMQSPGGQAWWSENRSMFSDDFGAFLDGLIASAPILEDGVFPKSTASPGAAQQSAAADSALGD